MADVEKALEALRDLLDDATYQSEYDGRMDTLCIGCHHADGEHAMDCAVIRGQQALAAGSAALPPPPPESQGCTTEQECEWMPWCRIHANCRRKVEQERTAKHVAAVPHRESDSIGRDGNA